MDIPEAQLNPSMSPAQIDIGVASRTGAAGKAIGAAIADLGGAFGQIAGRAGASQENDNSTAYKIEWEAGNTAIMNDITQNTPADGSGWATYPERVAKLTQDLDAKYGVTSQGARNSRDLWTARRTLSHGQTALGRRQKMAFDYHTGKETEMVGGLLRKLEGDPSDENAANILEIGTEHIRKSIGNYRTRAQAEKAIDDLRKSVTEARIKGLDPAAREELIGKITGTITRPSSGAPAGPGGKIGAEGSRETDDDFPKPRGNPTSLRKLASVTPSVRGRYAQLQQLTGEDLPVISGYRDPDHNRRVGGASGSRHLHGDAIDISLAGMSRERQLDIIATASALGFQGIGVYGNSIHLDMGGRRAWGPSYGSDSIPGWAKKAIDIHLAGNFDRPDPTQPRTGMPPTPSQRPGGGNSALEVAGAGDVIRSEVLDSGISRNGIGAAAERELDAEEEFTRAVPDDIRKRLVGIFEDDPDGKLADYITKEQAKALAQLGFKAEDISIAEAVGMIQNAGGVKEEDLNPRDDEDARPEVEPAAVAGAEDGDADDPARGRRVMVPDRPGADVTRMSLGGPEAPQGRPGPQGFYKAEAGAAAGGRATGGGPGGVVAGTPGDAGVAAPAGKGTAVAPANPNAISVTSRGKTITFSQEDLNRISKGEWKAIKAQAARDFKAFKTGVKREISGLEFNAKRGYMLPGERMEALKAAVARTRDPEIMARWDTAMRKITLLRDMSGKSVEQNQRFIDNIEATAARGGINTEGLKILEDAKDLVAKQKTALKDDALTWAHLSGNRQLEPLRRIPPAERKPGEVFTPESMAKRMEAAKEIQKRYGLDRIQLFTKAEREQFADDIKTNKMRPSVMATELMRHWGKDAASIALAQMKVDAPEAVYVGQLRMMVGDSNIIRDYEDGDRLRKGDDFKNFVTARETLPEMETALGKVFTGGAGFGQMEFTDTLRSMATTAYIGRARREGWGEFKPEKFREIVNELLGASNVNGITYGGITKFNDPSLIRGWNDEYETIAPHDVQADKFDELILNHLNVKDIKGTIYDGVGRPLDDNGFRDAKLIPIGSEKYLLADPNLSESGQNLYYRDKDGKRFVFDFSTVRPILKRRASTLFRDEAPMRPAARAPALPPPKRDR